MACLDTATLLDLMGRGGVARQQAASTCTRRLVGNGERLTTTRLNVAELWVGIERAKDRLRERKKVHDLLEDLEILDFDQSCAELFGKLYAHLQTIGRVTEDMDLLIASIALHHGESLITRNVRHFADVPGLQLVGY